MCVYFYVVCVCRGITKNIIILYKIKGPQMRASYGRSVPKHRNYMALHTRHKLGGGGGGNLGPL